MPVALAYVMQKAPYVFPIVGGRNAQQLQANLEALEITLSKQQIAFIESIVPFDAGYPHNMIVSRNFYGAQMDSDTSGSKGDGTEQNEPLRRTIYYEQHPTINPILPSQ